MRCMYSLLPHTCSADAGSVEGILGAPTIKRVNAYLLETTLYEDDDDLNTNEKVCVCVSVCVYVWKCVNVCMEVYGCVWV